MLWFALKNVSPQLIVAGVAKLALQEIILSSLFLIMHPVSTAAVTFPSRTLRLLRRIWLHDEDRARSKNDQGNDKDQLRNQDESQEHE